MSIVRQNWWQRVRGLFNPGTPLQTIKPEQAPRQWSYPMSWNIQLQPRREDSRLRSFAQLRALAANYDVAEICINTRIEQIVGEPWNIVAKDSKAQKHEQGTCDALTAVFQRPDKQQLWGAWLTSLLYDLMTIDATSIYVRPARGGGVYGLELIDGATIKPLLTDNGKIGGYQQILYGLPWADFKTTNIVELDMRELIYAPRWTRTFTAYGHPPTEWIITRIETALRKQQQDLGRFTEGNIPAGILSPPDGMMSPEQIARFEEWWNAKLRGDDLARTRLTFLPWAGKLIQTQQLSEGGRYESALDEYMLKLTCAAYGVTPSEIGFTADVNRATADSQENVTYRRGIGPLTTWLKQLMDVIISDVFEQPQCKWEWIIGETSDKLLLAQIEQADIAAGVLLAEESRQRRYPDLPALQKDTPDPTIAMIAKNDQRDKARKKDEDKAEQAIDAALIAQRNKLFDLVEKTSIDDLIRAIAQFYADRSLMTQALLPVIDDLLFNGAIEALDLLPISVDFDLVNSAALAQAQSIAAALATKLNNTSQVQAAKIVSDWIAIGGTMTALKQRLQRVYPKQRANAIAVTNVTQIYAQANQATWRASGVVQSMQWHTVRDKHVCKICEAKNNTIIPLHADIKQLPPAHVNCRCWLVPNVIE